ncbi:hypothetical protein AB0B39_23580 [Micromonospora sp. NPDC049114]|uniref:hypothetical protein n=1 Tax=Micromonospora sp. NPDC049114 TaxID=3155498 RepID=UPI0033E7623C
MTSTPSRNEPPTTISGLIALSADRLLKVQHAYAFPQTILAGIPPLPRDRDGFEYGTAAQLAALITSADKAVTAGTIRNWAYLSRQQGHHLYGQLPAIHIPGRRTGQTYYRLLDVAQVAAKIEAGVRSP